jgi:hypothetical protein
MGSWPPLLPVDLVPAVAGGDNAARLRNVTCFSIAEMNEQIALF